MKKNIAIYLILALFVLIGYRLFTKFDVNRIIGFFNKSTSLEQSNLNLCFNEPKNKPDLTCIKVFKSKRILELYGDKKLIGRFKVGLGTSPQGKKKEEGDGKTPEGTYYICTKNDDIRYKFFMGISYPNIEDAEIGLKNKLIDEDEFSEIKNSIEKKRKPTWKTALGGEIGLQGGGSRRDWTLGCISLEDEDLKIIWDYSSVGTAVEIYK